MTPHKTVELDGKQIDELLSPAISALWAEGISTTESCQGDYVDGDLLKNAYIAFPDSAIATKFHKTLVKSPFVKEICENFYGNRASQFNYLDLVAGRWRADPKKDGRLIILIEWSPACTDRFVNLIVKTFNA